MPSKKTFEENLQDLEAIVTKLENGDVVLECFFRKNCKKH